ncbi:hypothetical protein ACTXT7_012352 [Hymenolepis weldensis]
MPACRVSGYSLSLVHAHRGTLIPADKQRLGCLACSSKCPLSFTGLHAVRHSYLNFWSLISTQPTFMCAGGVTVNVLDCEPRDCGFDVYRRILIEENGQSHCQLQSFSTSSHPTFCPFANAGKGEDSD